jgi:mono/diheme cytochrome c family protein
MVCPTFAPSDYATNFQFRTLAVAGGSYVERRSKHRRRQWLAAAILLLAAVTGILYWRIKTSPLNRLYDPPNDYVTIPTDAAAIARGKHMVEAVAVCTICHGVNLGGKLAFSDSFLGRGYTSNLTVGLGGVGRSYTDADWIRSIRYGVRPDGHGIPFMPSDYFNKLTDADTGAIIAYLKTLPPVDNERTRVEIKSPARILISLGVFGDLVRAAKIDFRAPRPPAPNDEGAYLVEIGGCTFCHGIGLMGGQGPEPGAPRGTDLTRTGPLSQWSFLDFRKTMRNGVDPRGHAIDPKFMPWLGYRNMTDAELNAIWLYLRSLNARN